MHRHWESCMDYDYKKKKKNRENLVFKKKTSNVEVLAPCMKRPPPVTRLNLNAPILARLTFFEIARVCYLLPFPDILCT
jgi:hypothetical protein